MFKLSSDFWKSKTTWTSISAVVAAVGAFFTHRMDLMHTFWAIFAALQTAFIRDALVKR